MGSNRSCPLDRAWAVSLIGSVRDPQDPPVHRPTDRRGRRLGEGRIGRRGAASRLLAGSGRLSEIRRDVLDGLREAYRGRKRSRSPRAGRPALEQAVGQPAGRGPQRWRSRWPSSSATPGPSRSCEETLSSFVQPDRSSDRRHPTPGRAASPGPGSSTARRCSTRPALRGARRSGPWPAMTTRRLRRRSFDCYPRLAESEKARRRGHARLEALVCSGACSKRSESGIDPSAGPFGDDRPAAPGDERPEGQGRPWTRSGARSGRPRARKPP